MDILNTKIKQILTEKSTKIKPENIKSGINILGVQGSSKVLDTTDANAVANDIVTGKTAYVNGQKLTGTYAGIIPSGSINIIQNGTTDVSQYASANVNVPTPAPSLQSKSITITENGTQTIVADTGYDGLDEVEITTNISGGGNTNVLMDDTLNYQGNFGGYEIITKVTSLDTSNFSTTKNLFSGFSELIEVPQQLVTNQVTDMQYMFSGCKKLTFIPEMNTSNVTNMYYMFNGCKKLITVPLLNTSKVTRMNNMFSGCTSLSNDSLNNILAMCINATAYTSTKTLTILGFRAYQHSQAKIEALSNYQAFLNAGWTTGY